MERIIWFIIIMSFPQKVLTTNRSFACGEFVSGMTLMSSANFIKQGPLFRGDFEASQFDMAILNHGLPWIATVELEYD